jgi:hypothetical protein
MHRAPDPLIGAATADVRDGIVDLGVARLGIGLEKRGHGHDLAGLAIAALRHVVLEPGALHRMGRIRGQALDGGDRDAVDGADRHRARPHGLAIDVHGASAALGDAATVFCPSKTDFVPQHPKQRCLVLDVELVQLAVDRDRYHRIGSVAGAPGFSYGKCAGARLRTRPPERFPLPGPVRQQKWYCAMPGEVRGQTRASGHKAVSKGTGLAATLGRGMRALRA